MCASGASPILITMSLLKTGEGTPLHFLLASDSPAFPATFKDFPSGMITWMSSIACRQKKASGAGYFFAASVHIELAHFSAAVVLPLEETRCAPLEDMQHHEDNDANLSKLEEDPHLMDPRQRDLNFGSSRWR